MVVGRIKPDLLLLPIWGVVALRLDSGVEGSLVVGVEALVDVEDLVLHRLQFAEVTIEPLNWGSNVSRESGGVLG